ncbi:MAG: hypothetical protein AAF311_07235 [Pseudomonadota bacterium]
MTEEPRDESKLVDPWTEAAQALDKACNLIEAAQKAVRRANNAGEFEMTEMDEVISFGRIDEFDVDGLRDLSIEALAVIPMPFDPDAEPIKILSSEVWAVPSQTLYNRGVELTLRMRELSEADRDFEIASVVDECSSLVAFYYDRDGERKHLALVGEVDLAALDAGRELPADARAVVVANEDSARRLATCIADGSIGLRNASGNVVQLWFDEDGKAHFSPRD